MKKHDGTISIEGVVGKGTMVGVLVPIIKTETEPDKTKAEQLSTGTKRILFVDDEPTIKGCFIANETKLYWN